MFPRRGAAEDDPVSTISAAAQAELEFLNHPSVKPVATDELHTITSNAQHEIEERVKYLYMDQDLPSTALTRQQHITYLVNGLEHLEESYMTLDASRPWLLYWILHALDLLGAIPDLPASLVDRIIAWLKLVQDPTGGFPGGPGQCPHLATTFASVNACAILSQVRPGALQLVDREKLYQFLLSVKAPSGAFMVQRDGEIDTRGCYLALSVASLVNIMTPELTAGTAEWLLSCQNWEGGFGGEPGNEAHGGYSYCGLAALMILGQANRINLNALQRWASARQMTIEGGFQGRTNKLVDGCYSFWVGALFPLLDFVTNAGKSTDRLLHHRWVMDQIALQRYLLVACQQAKGGLRDKPGKRADFYHTCYCLAGLSIAQNSLTHNDDLVLGLPSNRLLETNPLYNIRTDVLPDVMKYYSTLPPP